MLERVNELLCPDIPEKMFVTCLYGVVDPASGRFRFANAGHNLPYARTADGAVELRATGMPLGLMPGMNYEEKEAWIAPGESLLLYSDGVTEAHSTEREMYGTPRLAEFVAGGERADRRAADEPRRLHRRRAGSRRTTSRSSRSAAAQSTRRGAGLEQAFRIESRPGNEREAMERVAAAVAPLGLEPRRLDQLKTAVAEATMNAIEHGNESREELPVDIEVAVAGGELVVRITDEGIGGPDRRGRDARISTLKLEGLQKPRGWGLFLIENMVDEIRVSDADGRHTVELVLNLEGGGADGDR